MLDSLEKIRVESPIDQVIRQLRLLISSGKLSPGDVLPSERKLAEKLEVSRSTIRDAIKKMEFYGIVKTQPQSGTIVKGKGLLALEGFIIDILDFEEADFKSIVDTRNLLEIQSAGLAAKKRTEEDVSLIQNALKAHREKIELGESAEEEDFLLHLQIAEVSGNSVLKLLMRIFTPDILKKYTTAYRNKEDRNKDILDEHQDIVNQIIEQNEQGAKSAMKKHLKGNLASRK